MNAVATSGQVSTALSSKNCSTAKSRQDDGSLSPSRSTTTPPPKRRPASLLSSSNHDENTVDQLSSMVESNVPSVRNPPSAMESSKRVRQGVSQLPSAGKISTTASHPTKAATRKSKVTVLPPQQRHHSPPTPTPLPKISVSGDGVDGNRGKAPRPSRVDPE